MNYISRSPPMGGFDPIHQLEILLPEEAVHVGRHRLAVTHGQADVLYFRKAKTLEGDVGRQLKSAILAMALAILITPR